MLRKILLALGVLTGLAIVAVLVFGPAEVEKMQNRIAAPDKPWPVSTGARDLHRKLIIGDLHADSLLWDRDLLKRVSRGHADIPRLRDGNVAVQVFTAVTRSPRGQNYNENASDAPDNITPLVVGQLRPVRTWTSLLQRALDQAARLNAMAEEAPDELRIIRNRADLAEVLAARAAGGKLIGAIMGAEGAHPLEGRIENLDVMYDAGYRLLGITHFFDNELGGSLHGAGGSTSGLTDFGREVVLKMKEKHMIVDLAHASPQVVREVLAVPGLRPVVSHTGIYSQCRTHRNLPDKLLEGVADRGGLIGIGFWSDVTCDASPKGIAAAIVAAVNLLGDDYVALGSDFDGAVETTFDASELAALTEALLQAGLSEQTIAKVMGGNMMRYLSQVLPPE